MRTFKINILGFTIFQKQLGVGMKWWMWPSFHTPSLTTAYQGQITSLCSPGVVFLIPALMMLHSCWRDLQKQMKVL